MTLSLGYGAKVDQTSSPKYENLECDLELPGQAFCVSHKETEA